MQRQRGWLFRVWRWRVVRLIALPLHLPYPPLYLSSAVNRQYISTQIRSWCTWFMFCVCQIMGAKAPVCICDLSQITFLSPVVSFHRNLFLSEVQKSKYWERVRQCLAVSRFAFTFKDDAALLLMWECLCEVMRISLLSPCVDTSPLSLSWCLLESDVLCCWPNVWFYLL